MKNSLKLLITLLFFIQGCGKPNVDSSLPSYYYDSELTKWFDLFSADAKKYNINFDPSFVRVIKYSDHVGDVGQGIKMKKNPLSLAGDDETVTLAYCEKLKLTAKYTAFDPLPERKKENREWGEITFLSPSLWPESYTPEMMSIVAYHEFGHCFLGKDHTEDFSHNLDKYQIMNPIITDDLEFIRSNFDRLVKEFFTK